MNWTAAARVGMMAAAKEHRRYNVDLSRWVDVFDILERTDVVLAFRPMGRLEGAYLCEPDSWKGVILNSNRPLQRQRYTAAHELGHIVFGDESTADTIDIFSADRRDIRSDPEKLAESFAAWFLMPHDLLERCLKRMDLRRPATPEDVYQLSLQMGTSYEATARHMVSARIAPRTLSQQWLRVQLADVKRRLASNFPPQDIRNDVHIIGIGDAGSDRLLRAGDRVFLTLKERPTTGHRWRLTEMPDAVTLLHDAYVTPTRARVGEPPIRTGDIETRQIVFAVDDPGQMLRVPLVLDHKRAWKAEVLESFSMTLTIMPPQLLGIPEVYFAKEPAA